jgi:hypothetical protein
VDAGRAEVLDVGTVALGASGGHLPTPDLEFLGTRRVCVAWGDPGMWQFVPTALGGHLVTSTALGRPQVWLSVSGCEVS